MNFKITISEDKDYIQCKVLKNVTRETAVQIMTEYTELINKTGIYNILSDVRGIQNIMGPLDDYEYAYKDSQTLGFPKNIKLAILADKDDASHEFSEVVGQNAGYSIKVFHSEESALNWLKLEKLKPVHSK